MNENTSKNTVWKCAAALLGLLIIMALAGIALIFFWPTGNNSGSSAIKASQDGLQAAAPLEAETQVKSEIQIAGSGTASSRAETDEEEDEDLTADYIIPDSDTKLLTDSDIRGLSAKELNYAKNEIYARHGRIFDSKELREYFESKSWYNGQYTAEEFDERSGSILNSTEKKNADFLSDAENALEPGGYQLDQ